MALADYMTRKPISEIVSDIEHHGFSKSLGALSITFIGIGCIIGAGIFVRLARRQRIMPDPAS